MLLIGLASCSVTFDCQKLLNIIPCETTISDLITYLETLQDDLPLICLTNAVKMNDFTVLNLIMDKHLSKGTP